MESILLGFEALSPRANKDASYAAPQGRTCGGTPKGWAYHACPVLRSDCSISRDIEKNLGKPCDYKMF